MLEINYKKSKKHPNKSAVLFGLVLFFMPFPANAYLDPGTGSLILQALIGGLAAAGAFLSLYFQKIRTFFRGVLSRSKETEREKLDE